MKGIGSLFDYIDENHDNPLVKISLWSILSVLILTCSLGIAMLPTHEEYCKTTINNITCKGE